jgi:DNA mismatch endonuclease (patch repair protein)
VLKKRRDPKQVSFNMSQVKRSGSLIEQALSQAFREFRLRPIVQPKMFGHPDFAFKKYRIVVFCDSHFWHGYKWSVKKAEIRNNKRFWTTKIEGTMSRDREVNRRLRREGWVVLRFWEHDIKCSALRCAEKVRLAIEERKSVSNVLGCD